jgi:hypothetical protein
VTNKISNNDVNIMEVHNSFKEILMIIGIGLYSLGIGFFFVIKMITPWLSTMTITNG